MLDKKLIGTAVFIALVSFIGTTKMAYAETESVQVNLKAHPVIERVTSEEYLMGNLIQNDVVAQTQSADDFLVDNLQSVNQMSDTPHHWEIMISVQRNRAGELNKPLNKCVYLSI